MVEIYNEVDNVILVFPDDRAVEYWALSGEPTWSSSRPAAASERTSFSLTDLYAS